MYRAGDSRVSSSSRSSCVSCLVTCCVYRVVSFSFSSCCIPLFALLCRRFLLLCILIDDGPEQLQTRRGIGGCPDRDPQTIRTVQLRSAEPYDDTPIGHGRVHCGGIHVGLETDQDKIGVRGKDRGDAITKLVTRQGIHEAGAFGEEGGDRG